jgi:Carboxypeptidase regulatory-like domain/TonB dependent receptor-like, beta-barrel
MNQTKRWIGGLRSLLFCVLSCTAVFAQSTAQINGTVKDQSGAVLPGVEVTVTQTDTGVQRSMPTDETGSFVLSNLPIGPYRLEAALPGFRTYVQTGIVLQVSANPTINPVLEVGQLTEQVEVQANAALVETRSAGVGTVVDNQRVLELPLNGRNVTELIFLAGMANVSSGNMNSVRNYPTIIISVAGGLSNGTTYLLDGAVHNDVENNLNLPLPFPDALQEFKVETSALPAKYGLHSAAAVNAVTKAGTNDFHGDAFEFVRNGIFNARNFFAPVRDNLKRNQFGGVIGGPIKKNKLFFFAGYQGTVERSAPPQSIAYVPTPAMLAGDFTTFASPGCNNGRQINLAASQGFVNNQISPSRFEPAALRIAAKLPTAQADPCGKVTYGLISNQNEHVIVSRLDQVKSDKQSLFARLFIAKLTAPSTYDGKNPLTILRNATDNRVYTLALGDTYLLGPNTVSTFRASITRTAITKIPDNTGTWADFGVKATSLLQPVIRLSVTGNGFAWGNGSAIVSVANTGPNYEVSEDLGLVRGNHQWGFGGTYLHMLNAYHAGVNGDGTMTFNGQTTGLGLADFLMGSAVTWKQGNLSTYYNREHYIGAYAQDAWKVTPRLTLSYGVRWEPYLPWSSKYGWFSHFDKDLFDQGVRSKVFVNSPAGMIYPGDDQYECGTKIECNRWNEFLPRIGLAWDPMGDGRMSVRAGYGMFLDRQMVISLTGFGQNAPFGNAITLNNVRLSDPWATYPGGDPFPTVVNRDVVFSTFGLVSTHPMHAKPTIVNQWNLSLQRQIGTDWLVTANYVGSATNHLFTGNEQNPAIFLGLGPCTINNVQYSVCSTTANSNQRRRLYLQNPSQGQFYGSIGLKDDGGTGSYNGLYLSVQKRLSSGFSVLANHTWSHCISDLFLQNVGASAGSTNYPDNRRAERSNCVPFDQRHVFNLSAVVQTPKFSNRGLRLIAGDWQLSPIMKIKSGQFITVTGGVDYALNGAPQATSQRPNQVLANVFAAEKTVDHWLNPAAFAAPAPGTYGNMGANNIAGPGMFQLDLAITRTFPVGEGKTLQFRGEAFNLPNHMNPSNPVSTLNSTGSFGKIQSDISGTSGLSAGDQRILQFALKYMF